MNGTNGMHETKYLSAKEYANFRTIFGLVSELLWAEDHLQARIRMVPNGWRDYRLCTSTLQRLITKLLETVPMEKVAAMKQELKQLRVEVNVRQAPKGETEDITCVPYENVAEMIGRLQRYECITCEKTGKETRRCKLRKCFDGLHHYEVTRGQQSCPYSYIDWKEEIDDEE